MPSVGRIPPPLSKEALRELLLEGIEKIPEWQSPETFHALFDNLDRRLSTDDVIHGIKRKWDGWRVGRFDRDEWQRHYEIDTESVDGDKITIVVAVDTVRREFTVVTRWREDDTPASDRK